MTFCESQLNKFICWTQRSLHHSSLCHESLKIWRDTTGQNKSTLIQTHEVTNVQRNLTITSTVCKETNILLIWPISICPFKCGIIESTAGKNAGKDLWYSPYTCCLSVKTQNQLPLIRRWYTAIDESSQISKLTDCIKDIKHWMSCHFLLLNFNKTEILLTGPKTHKQNISDYKLMAALVKT